MAYERYHIPIKVVPSTAPKIPKFEIIRADNCVNCGKCEKACIFGVHKRSEPDPRKMDDPVSHLCKNCFRCIADCPQRALTMAVGSEYRTLGHGVWTPLRISTIWSEAETGKIPVFGAGYRGRFAGSGFDGMWTDMSEIVRPTRDGIHGREYISTIVDIGRMPLSLKFDDQGQLVTKMPPVIEISIPMIFDATRLKGISERTLVGFARATNALDTLMLVPSAQITSELMEVSPTRIVPVLDESADPNAVRIDPRTQMVELRASSNWRAASNTLMRRFPDKVVALRMPVENGIEDTVFEMLDADIPVVHLDYDDDGLEQGEKERRHAKESLRALHSSMTVEGVRDEITVIAGGGIAAAEHVPKSIVCGSDAVALEKALMVALDCRYCSHCTTPSCPVSLAQADPEWVEARVSNLIGAWRDQLLEVLGAMGIREVRRLRGETGRAIFFEEIEHDLDDLLEPGGDRVG